MVLAISTVGVGLVLSDGASPGKPTTTSLSVGKTTASLWWVNSTSGDDCYSGSPTSYEVRQSTTNITNWNWFELPVVANGTCVGSGDQCAYITGLGCNSQYYFALFLIDEEGNRSSPAVHGATTLGCGSSTETSCE
jgi:hypothetical protein